MTDPAAANMTRFTGLDLIIDMNWTRGSLWPIMGLTTQTNHQLAINALNGQGYHMVSPPLPGQVVTVRYSLCPVTGHLQSSSLKPVHSITIEGHAITLQPTP